MAAITIINVIERAARKINLNPEGVSPSAEQAAEFLAEMNVMHPAWEESNVYLQWYFQTSTTANYPGPEYALQGVIGQLAVRMASNYGIAIPPELSNQLGTGYADMGWQTILRKAINQQLPRADMGGLSHGSGARTDFDITKGWP